MLSQALHGGLCCPSLWLRYVDDIIPFWPHSNDEFHAFYLFLNQLRPSIRFNVEREREGCVSFLDVSVQRSHNSLSFSVFRKPTHTDLYVQRDSAHPSSVFKGIVCSLSARARRICSSSQLHTELRHLSRVFRLNGFSASEITRGLRTRPSTTPTTPSTRKRCSIPYVRGVSERLGSILREVGIQPAMRPPRTLRSLLVNKRPIQPKSLGSVYLLQCSSCPWKYVGETGRTVEERKKEHQRAVREMDVERSEIARHAVESGHRIDFDGMRVVAKEKHWRRHVVKEANWTRKKASSNKVKHDIGGLWSLSLSFIFSHCFSCSTFIFIPSFSGFIALACVPECVLRLSASERSSDQSSLRSLRPASLALVTMSHGVARKRSS